MLIPLIAGSLIRKVTHVCVLAVLATSLQGDVCRSSKLERIRELTKQFLPDTLSQILASIESTRTRREQQDPSVEVEQDRQYSEVDRENEDYGHVEEDRPGKSVYLEGPSYRPLERTTQDDTREESRRGPSLNRDDGQSGASYEQTELYLKDQISQLSADLFKLDEPLFDDPPQPPIKRIETRVRKDEAMAADSKYSIDEIVDKVRARLLKDFQRHGYGYLIDDTRQATNVRQENYDNYKQRPRQKDYGQKDPARLNVFKDSAEVGHEEEESLYPYVNQEKREVISQEDAKNDRPDSRFQVLNQPKLKYAVDGVAKEIAQGTDEGGPAYKKEDGATEGVADDLMVKKPIGKKGTDSYEDYVIPPKEANIYASEEVSPRPQKEPRNNYNNNNNHNEQRGSGGSGSGGGSGGGRQVTSQTLQRHRTITEPVLDYTEMTMADTRHGAHAVTEIMRWEYDEHEKLKEDATERTRQHTLLPTRKKFISQSPNYYISQPTVVEKFNFDEPIPVNDQVAEDQGPKVGLADNPEISVNKRTGKQKRILHKSQN